MRLPVRVDVIAGLILMLLLPVLASPAASAEDERVDGDFDPIAVPNPATDLWNAVRERRQAEARTQDQGTDASSLINTSGEEWQTLRTEELIPIGGYVLLGALGLVMLLFILKPVTEYEGGESSRKIRRFDVSRLVGHWFMAAVMIFLAVTGLVLLLGRFLMLPWMGPDVFSAIASASKEGHDLFGPVFAFALLVFFIQLVRRNLPEKGDFRWLLQFGGLFSDKHLPAGFFNAGEKMLFWLVVSLGAVLTVSGFAILFQNLFPGRDLMQLATLIHAIAAILLICVVFGHIYMAVSYKGTLNAMKTGIVDANWAYDHHRYWYEEMEARGEIRELIFNGERRVEAGHASPTPAHQQAGES
jgi:formate dehydrogenase subunit gamma